MQKKLNTFETNLLLFLEGFVSVALQIFIIRQLIPFVGSSVIIVSFVVSFFLAALAIGYYVGGKKRENQIERFSFNLIISGILISFSFSYYFMDMFFDCYDKMEYDPLLTLSIYLSLFLFPIVILLGQSIPLLTNFVKQNSVSEVTGFALSLNTIGSVIGSVLTSLILFHYIGVAYTLFVILSILMFILLYISSNKKIFLRNSIFAIIVLSLNWILSIQYENNNFLTTTSYSNYEIEEFQHNNDNYKVFKINDSYSSAIINDSRAFDYINYIILKFMDYEIKDKNVLILGSGGFTISNFYPKNEYTYVDIDAKIKDVAENNFLDTKIKGTFIDMDARLFVKNNDKKYDAIVVDLFQNRTSIPWHLTTKEFMENVYDITEENGFVFINTIILTDFSDDYSKKLHNTINSVFDYCFVVPLNIGYGVGTSNVEYLCRKKEKEEKYIFIDNVTDY